MPEHSYSVYILSNPRRTTFYVGVTGDLPRRIEQHRSKTIKGFTSQYGCTHLLYAESFKDVRDALTREKQLKGYRREKKLSLIRSENPAFLDISAHVA